MDVSKDAVGLIGTFMPDAVLAVALALCAIGGIRQRVRPDPSSRQPKRNR